MVYGQTPQQGLIGAESKSLAHADYNEGDRDTGKITLLALQAEHARAAVT